MAEKLADKILVVEDDASIRSGLRLTLDMEGFEVQEAADGGGALKTVSKWIPDLMILDLMLPGMSGFDVCREVRAQHPEIFVLMLTARTDEASKVAGLMLGADDYVAKPFGVAELVARIHSLLRRKARLGGPAAENPHVVRWGRVAIDFRKFKCEVEGKPVDLSTREFEILRDFAAHPGEVVHREDLLERVWGYSPDNLPSTRTVDNFIVRLRQKLEQDPAEPELLVSVRGAGYRLEVPTE